MYARYSLFHSHIDLAHKHWAELIKPGDTVIDATCGNGHDAIVLAGLALTKDAGKLYAMDLQPEAIESTRHMLFGRLTKEQFGKVSFIQGCHSVFPEEVAKESVKVIAYNLGYLPGGDKAKTTRSETTLKSLLNAQELLSHGGLLSITCYPGHAEGKEEEQTLLDYTVSLDPKMWSCCHHRWTNRKNAPSLLLMQKRI